MKQFFLKQNLILASMALAASISPIANAGIQWDPDGGGVLPTQDLGAFDWSQSSFVAVGGNTAIANKLGIGGGSCAGGGCDFQVFSHARLGSTTDSSSASNTPGGLNSTFEYTMVMGFYETVTSVLTAGDPFAPFGAAAFKTDMTKPSFLEIYYDKTPDSDALSGYGFSDGELVLRGLLNNNATGSFSLSDSTAVPLDGFGAQNYTGQTTSPGTGSNNNINFKAVEQNLAYFKQAVDSLGINFTNISLGLPYLQVDPSDCFNDTAKGALGTYAETECNLAHVNGVLDPTTQPLPFGFSGLVPDASPGNTTLSGADANPDFVSQTDYNASLNGVPVPEPSSLLMLGVGLLGMFRVASKRQRG